MLLYQVILNPFNSQFTIVTFIHYKPRIAVVVVDEGVLKWVKIQENFHVSVKKFHGNFPSKVVSCRKIKSVF